jgi:aerobic carbon-monoxide dehydrogenase medium subunit
MYSLSYVKASSVADAVKLLAQHPDAKLLSGGMTMIPSLKQRLAQPSHLIDISGITEMHGIEVKGDRLVIGAATKHFDVASSAVVKKAIPALAALANQIGDPQVRNMGTMGGSVSNNDPAADYPSAVLALNATVHTNKRDIAADDFFQGMFATALGEGEIVTRISFPLPKRAAYQKFPHPASGYAMTGVFVADTAGGIRVAVTGAGPGVFRWKDAEAALAKSFAAASLASLKVDATNLNADIHAPAEYRANLVKVMATRAVTAITG